MFPIIRGLGGELRRCARHRAAAAQERGRSIFGLEESDKGLGFIIGAITGAAVAAVINAVIKRRAAK